MDISTPVILKLLDKKLIQDFVPLLLQPPESHSDVKGSSMLGYSRSRITFDTNHLNYRGYIPKSRKTGSRLLLISFSRLYLYRFPMHNKACRSLALGSILDLVIYHPVPSSSGLIQWAIPICLIRGFCYTPSCSTVNYHTLVVLPWYQCDLKPPFIVFPALE